MATANSAVRCEWPAVYGSLASMALTSARKHLEIAALDGEQQLAVVGVVLIEPLRGLVEGARQLGDLGRPFDGHADAERAGRQPTRALDRGAPPAA